MKEFTVGLIFLFVVFVLAGLGILFYPLVIVMALFLRVIVVFGVFVLITWLLGKFIMFIWDKLQKK